MSTDKHNGSGFSEIEASEIVRDLDTLASWLESNGIRHAGTRLEIYQRHLRGFVEAEKQRRQLEFSREVGRDDLYNAMFEASEWQSICQAFRQEVPDKELCAALRKAVGGPEFYDEEEATKTNARDTQFELSMGALLKRAGFPVRFDRGGDLWFPLRQSELFVECKRVQTTKKIRARVGEAQSQLARRYKAVVDPSVCRGLVAISVTKAVNPEPRRRPSYPTWLALRAELRHRAQQVLDRFEDAWPAEDARTIGVAVEFRSMSWVETGTTSSRAGKTADPFICPASQIAWHSVRPQFHLDELLLQDIAGRVTAAA